MNSATIERWCNKFAEVLGLGWDKSISRSWLDVSQNFNSLTGTFTKVSSKPGDKEAQTSCKESKENIYPAWTLSELCPQVPIPSESGQIGRNYFGLKELAERFVFIWNINNGWTWCNLRIAFHWKHQQIGGNMLLAFRMEAGAGLLDQI